MKKLWLMLFVLLLVACPVASQEDDAPPVFCVSVWYYPSAAFIGGYDALMDNQDVIDEVNPFWYNPLADGTLQPVPEAENADQLRAWREAGFKIVPTIFSSISMIIADETIRTTHVQAIRAMVLAMDYDGIDIDYEGFPANTRENFSLFIEELAAVMHAEGRELSVTVHAKTDDLGAWEGTAAQDWSRLAPAADTFRIMTYDYTNRNEPPGPISPLRWVIDVLAYAETVVDLSKVRMGVHFYGYTWQRGTPPAQTITWSSIQNWMNNLGAEIQRDPVDMEAFLDFRVTGLPRQTVYVADPIGLDFKLEHITAAFPTLGGVSIWGIGGEHPGLWDTLRHYTTGCRES